jgi:hypothetical protein
VTGEAVLVEHQGSWLRGRVLWQYLDIGRPRALIRYLLPSGFVVRRLHWRDELRSPSVVIELQLRRLPVPALQHPADAGEPLALSSPLPVGQVMTSVRAAAGGDAAAAVREPVPSG